MPGSRNLTVAGPRSEILTSLRENKKELRSCQNSTTGRATK